MAKSSRSTSMTPDSPAKIRQTIPRFTTPARDNVYDAADAAAAWERRRRDLDDLGGIIDVLADVERRADELNRRAAELAAGWL